MRTIGLFLKQTLRYIVTVSLCVGLVACASTQKDSLPALDPTQTSGYEYLIGPGDTLNIFVWRNPDVSVEGIPIRPDGKVSAPLVGDLEASGKTAKALANEIEEKLATYIQEPFVTVTVVGFTGGYAEQVRVVGEAVAPAALPYRKNMTALDVMISVGGLTEFAAGNRARLIRVVDGQPQQSKIRLADLLQEGDITANVQMFPGDILIIPEAWF